jgi:multidrug efflux pump
VVAVFLLRFVPQQFFPASDRPELTMDMTLPQSASIHATQAHVERMEALLKDDPDIDHYSTYVGRGAIRFILTLNVQLANPFFAQFVIVAKDVEARARLHTKLEKLLAEEFPDVVGYVSPLELGPPVGWPLQYRVSGPDPDEVRRIAQELANVVGSEPRTRHVNFDWMEPARQLRVNVNQDQARQLGISSAALAGTLNAAITGTTVTQIRDDIYLVNVVARATDAERASFETLSSLQVATPGGRMVPLRQFATFSEEQELPLIWRRDRVPTLTVRADVNPGVLADSVVGDLAPKIEEFAASLPRPYQVATGGLYEESAVSRGSVFAVVPLMIALMLIIMMVPAGQFPPAGAGGGHHAAGAHRRGADAAAVQPAAGLRRDPRRARVDRHDRQERGHPDRADRNRPGRRQGRVRRRDRIGIVAHAADDARGHVDHPRSPPDRAHRVLGPDGLCHHGRPAGGDHADARAAAHLVRRGLR